MFQFECDQHCEECQAEMNAVETEQAASHRAEASFNPARFPNLLLEALENNETTLERLRVGSVNQPDRPLRFGATQGNSPDRRYHRQRSGANLNAKNPRRTYWLMWRS